MAISNEGAARLAEATVKLWDLQDNRNLGKFFRFTAQEFTTWKTDHEIRRTIGEEIEQNATGLLTFTTAWEERLPTSNRCIIKIQEAVVDAARTRGYPEGIRTGWYRHIKMMDPPAQAADQEWIDILNEVIKNWRETANFMISKHAAGMAMINEERAYQEASMNAVTLTGDLYTETITYNNAIAAARNLTTQGSKWADAANLYYPLTPDTIGNTRGMLELIGPMELVPDYDYDNLKQDILNNFLIIFVIFIHGKIKDIWDTRLLINN